MTFLWIVLGLLLLAGVAILLAPRIRDYYESFALKRERRQELLVDQQIRTQQARHELADAAEATLRRESELNDTRRELNPPIELNNYQVNEMTDGELRKWTWLPLLGLMVLIGLALLFVFKAPWWVALLAPICVGIIYFAQCSIVVEAPDIGFLLFNGKPVKVKEAGFSLLLPFFMKLKLETTEARRVPCGDPKLIVKHNGLELNVEIDLSVYYAVDPCNALCIFQMQRDEVEELIRETALSATIGLLGGEELMTAIGMLNSNRVERDANGKRGLEAEIRASVEKELRGTGYRFVKTQVRDIHETVITAANQTKILGEGAAAAQAALALKLKEAFGDDAPKVQMVATVAQELGGAIRSFANRGTSPPAQGETVSENS